MAYFTLSSISGCTNPTGATFHDAKYNDALIMEYFKKEYEYSGTITYSVVVSYGVKNAQFDFGGVSGSTYRDAFYNRLP